MSSSVHDYLTASIKTTTSQGASSLGNINNASSGSEKIDADLARVLGDLSNYALLRIPVEDTVFKLITRWAITQGNCTSAELSSGFVSMQQDFGNQQGKKDVAKEPKTLLMLGRGRHNIDWKGETVSIVVRAVGEPVGCGRGPCELVEMVLLVQKRLGVRFLQEFVEYVMDQMKQDRGQHIQLYLWNVRNQFWEMLASKPKRSMDSVILPTAVRDELVNDVTDFFDEATARFYLDHGIPYKRSYMLTGPPGNGKTSFVTAVASKFDLNVAFLQPAEAGMTDSLMAKAMQRVPKNSVIVLEDVDALFDPNRKSATEGNALTFSGMLNALDGLTSPTGQIFFLTTNHQERLDSAMLRDGRVDVRCEFPYATKEQFQFMFLSFYKNEDALAEEFVAILSPLIGKISMSKLQSFFLKNRRNPAHAAISELPEWVAKLARDLEADAQMQEKARMEVEKREVAKKEAAAAARQAKDLADKTVKNPLSLSRSHE